MTEAHELAALLRGSRKAVFFGGAGVSTESGIPDFRSEAGLYAARSVYGYPPEVLLSHSFFARAPGVFFKYYKENLIYRDVQPNAAHLALAKLERAGRLSAVITQNIDGLHQAAGSRNVLELHGSNHRHTCTQCARKYTLDYVLDPGHCQADGVVPRCEHCGGLVRPDVVLYEEGLDERVMRAAAAAVTAADLLVVGGTSLSVYPAAGLLRNYQGENLVLINKSETPYDGRASLVIRASIGEVLRAATENIE